MYCSVADVAGMALPPGRRFDVMGAVEAEAKIKEATAEIDAVLGGSVDAQKNHKTTLRDLRQICAVGTAAKLSGIKSALDDWGRVLSALPTFAETARVIVTPIEVEEPKPTPKKKATKK